jgi:hypothetical protein
MSYRCRSILIRRTADSGVIGVDDLAVTADADQMYLVQHSTGRRVIPRIPHALDTSVQSPPLTRFLAEVADARSAVFGGLDLGAARTLPYVPRIRYRRTVLAAAGIGALLLRRSPGSDSLAGILRYVVGLTEPRRQDGAQRLREVFKQVSLAVCGDLVRQLADHVVGELRDHRT